MVRKRTKRTNGSSTKPREVKRSDGKLKQWESISDIPLDEEDQFHTSRDKILLDGDDVVGDEDGDEDEIFRLKGMSDDEDDGDGEEEEEEEEDMDTRDFGHGVEPSPKKKTTSKTKAKKKASESSSEGGSESEGETWGRSKSAYYSSNAADLESDEEANELEEQEAKRLQRRARDAMTDDDFGLQDPVEVEAYSEDLVAYPLPTQVISDKNSSIRHLEKNSPETLALARDWEDTAWGLIRCRDKINKLEGEEPDTLSLGMIHLHYQTLLTYATTLAFYFHLRSSEKYIQRPELLHAHPVFPRLLTLKQSLATLEDLDFAISDSEDDNSQEQDEDDVLIDAQQLWKHDRKTGLDPGELDELLKDASLPSLQAKRNLQHAKEERPKKKRKTTSATTDQVLLPEFDLIEPVFTPSKSSLPRAHADSGTVDAFGEATSLHYADAADKSARKRTLRFHTTRIGSASMRRQGARSNAIGGDDDLPYKERRKEKEARLLKETKMNVRDQGGEDLDDNEPETFRKDKDSQTGADDAGADEEGTNGYYELIKQRAKEKREQRKAEYEATKSVERPDIDYESISGPRSLTRAMLTNKGLTPHRPKSVRNPRVKKRQKFEKAKRKVSSQKAVYKGGIGDTGKYSGEKSGISKVVKSVRLG